MQKFDFLNAYEISNLEEYGYSLFAAVKSLQSIQLVHDEVKKKGIIDEQESLTALEIDGKIGDLITLHQKQLENLKDNVDFNEEECLKLLHKMYPELKVPRKRKNAAKDLKKQMKEEDVPVVSPSAIE